LFSEFKFNRALNNAFAAGLKDGWMS